MSTPPSPATTLHARGLCLRRGGHLVLADVSLTVAPAARVGVVGPNGVGKSTLLRVLAGVEPADDGRVTLVPPTATVGYLAQEPERLPGESVRDLVARRTGVAAAEAELAGASAALAGDDPDAADRYHLALERFLALGAADLDARLGEQLAELGLPPALAGSPAATLSGGQAARVALAALLLARFDVLLLDEPTNDLDFDGLDRLEAHVAARPGGIVVVSHDRDFLDRVVTDVVEITEHDGRAHHFAGGWQAYQDERATVRRHAEEEYATYTAARGRLRDRAQTERQWATRGVAKVKRSGETDKFMRHRNVQSSEQLAARAKRTERALARLEVVDKPWEGWELRMQIAGAPRSGDVVAELEDVEVGRGTFQLGPIDLVLRAGERVAILGANGSGKTTLLDVILGALPPDRGRSRLGPSVRVGIVDQRRAGVGEPEETLATAFPRMTGLTTADARSLLAKFGLGADHLERPVATLSPGERTRALLARFMATGVNTLVLDEPTNHLDLPAIEQLEGALGSFDGSLLLVTHDRRLLSSVDLTRVIELADGRIADDRLAG